MSCAKFYKSHSLAVMASYVSNVVTCRSFMLNRSPMSFLDSLVFSISLCKSFALDYFSKSTKKTWILPTFMNSIGEIPYMHLLVGSSSSSLSVGRLLGSLRKTSLAPLSLESSINPPLFTMHTSFLLAFSFIVEAVALAQLIFSPFSYTM